MRLAQRAALEQPAGKAPTILFVSALGVTLNHFVAPIAKAATNSGFRCLAAAGRGSVPSEMAPGFAAIQQMGHSTPVNLAFGTKTSVLDLAKKIAVLGDLDIDLVYRAARTGDIMDSSASSQLVTSLFPALQPTPLEVGLQETIEWFRSLPAYSSPGGARNRSGGQEAW